MHEGLQQEIETYEKRTPRSKAAHTRAEGALPLGVASNYRAYDPYPIFVRDGKGGHIHDIDGNEYIDFNLCFGALMAGHCHPGGGQGRAGKARHRHDVRHAARFGMGTRGRNLRALSGGDGALQQQRHGMHHARRAPGARRHRPRRIIKMEGGYHGLHDSVLVSLKPKASEVGDPNFPTSVPGGEGVPKATVRTP